MKQSVKLVLGKQTEECMTLEQIEKKIEVVRSKLAIYSELDEVRTKELENELYELEMDWLNLDVQANL